MTAAHKSGRPKIWPTLVLVAAVFSLFWPVLLHPDRVLFPTFSPFSDVMVIHWPKARLMAQSWQSGAGMPLWTPLILSGMPLAANQLAMLFYPPAWLFLLFPPEPIFNLLAIFHLLWGGLGLYLLLRQAHRLPPTAALFGSLVFALNGKWLAHLAGGHVSMVGAVAWLPWAVFGLMMHLRRPPKLITGWSLLAAVAVAMQILTHTLLVIYTGYLLIGLSLWYTLSNTEWRTIVPEAKRSRIADNRRSALKNLFSLALILLLAGLLGAVQLLPLAELAQFSNRSLSPEQAALYALSLPQLLLGLILPTSGGGHELIIYLGLVPLLLAPFGLSRKHRWGWFYGGLMILTILFALGPATPVHRLFYEIAPGFRWVRTPARAFLLTGMAAAMLTGFAVDRLSRVEWSPRVAAWLTRFIAAAGMLALLLGLGLMFGLGQVNRATIAMTILLPAAALLLGLCLKQVLPVKIGLPLLGLLLCADLLWFDASLLRFVPRTEALSPGRETAAWLAQQPGRFRVYSPSYSLPMQTAAAFDLSLVDGVEPVHLAAYDQFMARAGGYGDAGFSVTIPNFGDRPMATALQHTEPNLGLLGLLNTEYLAAAFPLPWPGLTLETQLDDVYIYRNELARPRAWLTSAADATPPDEAALLAAPYTPVSIEQYGPNQISLSTNVDKPGWLVLSEIWYPGWQAEVNGQAQPVERVGGLLRGVYLPQAGQYGVSLTYRPVSVRWGGWISLLAVAGMIGKAAFQFGRHGLSLKNNA